MSAGLPATALALELQRTAGNRAVARLIRDRSRPSQRAPARSLLRDPLAVDEPPAAGAAGGCGLCYDQTFVGAIGPRDAGTAVHNAIQARMWTSYPDMIQSELSVQGKRERGEIDLARVVPPNTLEIAEIKPQDSVDVAIDDIDWYIKIVKEDPRWKGYNVKPLELKVPRQPLKFDTLSPDCPTQDLFVANTKGLYLYFCKPSFKELKLQGCKCKKRRREDDDKHYPVIGDRVDDTDKADKKKPKGRDDNRRPPIGEPKLPPVPVPVPVPGPRPGHPLMDKETAAIVAGVAAAILAVLVAIGSIPSPLTILEAIGAALGLALARLLLALGIVLAAGTASAAGTDDGPGTDPGSGTSGKVKVPGSHNPKLPPAGVPTGSGSQPTKSQVTLPSTGSSAGKEGDARPAGGKAPTRGKAAAGGKAPAGGAGRARTSSKPPIPWATIEGLNFDNVWIGQELMVHSGKKGRDARLWWLTITDKVKHGDATTLTLQSFEEDDPTGGIPAGNVYIVTHPYLAPPEPKPTDPQVVVLGIAEARGLPAKAHEVRGEAIMVSMFVEFSRAMKEAQQRRALAGH